jgi:hypothetical protein
MPKILFFTICNCLKDSTVWLPDGIQMAVQMAYRWLTDGMGVEHGVSKRIKDGPRPPLLRAG